ncbi:sterol desaturase family protein [Sediminitomix flava]|uniref:C-5 sterol desaturase n=1 Tax=Sediminitomix flava TaxID=379075 RepID=A0A315ZBI3_SEDFL|nr:sterol desaturase family protein [Sediminitomix flava]PWJ42074.1 C-5 sterol desaturase [Sediminitomix flava]
MDSLEQIDFLDPITFLITFLAISSIVFFRYLLFSSFYHYLFFELFRKKYQKHFLNSKKTKRRQLYKEIYWSFISAFIFGLLTTLMIILWQNGISAIYLNLDSYPIWYIPVSILIVLFLHDTYYYWLHRWMHLPKVYKLIHKVHHESIHTSAMTSFSFHPIESVLQAIPIPLFTIFLPLHIYAILFILIIMTVSATINHAGVEVYPINWSKKWILKNIIGAKHHDIHHRKFNYNYGLYFNFWDLMMKTEDKKKSHSGKSNS